MSASGGAAPSASSSVPVAAPVAVPARALASAAPYKPFTRLRRVSSAIVGCFLMAFCGAQFSLGAWSDQFARAVNLPFTGIELMSSLLNAGTYGGALVCALLYRVLPPRVAPALLCLAAALMYVINNTLIWACAAGHLIVPSAAIPAFFFFLGLGSGALLTVALAVNVPLFPQDRGKIVGLLSGSMSLGGVIYAALFHAFDTVADFLAAFLASSVTIAVAGILTQRIQPPPPPAAPTSSGSAGAAKPAVLDIYGLALFSDARFYVAWTAFLIECGAALMLGNNIQQMLLSASETTLPSIMVTAYNVCSIIGRIGIGVISDALANRVQRAMWVFVALIATFVVLIIQAYVPATIYASSPLVGLSFGVAMATTLALIPEWFGTPHGAINNGIFFVGVAIGSLSFNNVTSALYVVHVPIGSDRCVGPNCFFEALLLTALCVVACSVILLAMLVLRSNCTRSRFPRAWLVQCCGRGLPSLGPQTTIDSLEKGLLQDA